MLNFIKKLFGFGKKEEKSEAIKKAEETLDTILKSYKEDVILDNSRISIPVSGITKEEAEKVFQKRIAEIEAEKTNKPVVEKTEETPAPKKKKKYYAPKKTTPKTEVPKTKPVVKKETVKTPKPKK